MAESILAAEAGNGIETVASGKKYFKFFLFNGLFNMSISVIWGAYYTYLPIILQGGNPNFASHATLGFGLSAFITGLIMSVDSILGTIFNPIFGAMGDRSLRRKEVGVFMGIIMSLFIIALPLIANIVTPETSGKTEELLVPLVLMIIAAFGAIMTDSIGASYRSGYKFSMVPKLHHNKMMSFSVTFGGIGFISITLLASYLYTLNTGYPFYIGALLQFLVILAFYFSVPQEVEKNLRIKAEIEKTKNKPNPLQVIKNLYFLLDKQAKMSILMIFILKSLTGFGVYGLQTYASSYLLLEVGVMPNLAAIATAVYFLGYMGAAMPIGYIADKASRIKLYIIGIVIAIMGGIFFLAVGSNFVGILIVAAFIGIGFSVFDVITIPYILSFLPDKSDYTGTAYSLAVALVVSTTFFIVPVIGFLIDLTGNYNTLFYVLIASCSLAFIPLKVLSGLTKQEA